MYINTVLRFLNKDFENIVKYDDNHTGSKGIEGFYSIESKILYFYFKGTNSKADWITDFLFFKTKVPYNNTNKRIKVHQGFIDSYKSWTREKLHEIVRKNKIEKFVVSGHSYGGAIAQLAAVDIQYNFSIEVECYTFGAPKLGNYYFVKSYNKRIPNTWNFINGNDLVPHLPLFVLGFLQIFTLGFFFGFFIRTKNKVQIGKKLWYKLFDFKDHYLSHYRDSF